MVRTARLARLSVVAMLAAGCSADIGDDSEKLYGLSETQAQFSRACHQAIIRANVEYRFGARSADGCSCVADQLERLGADADDAAYYALAGELVKTLTAAAKIEKENAARADAMIDGFVRSKGPGAAILSRDMSSALAKCGERGERADKKAETRCETMTTEEKQATAKRLAEHGAVFDTATCKISRAK